MIRVVEVKEEKKPVVKKTKKKDVGRFITEREVRRPRINESIYDKFFKRIMENPRIAKEFMRKLLPHEMKYVEEKSIRLEPTMYTGSGNRELIADVVFKFRKKNDRIGYIYFLFEHKSSDDNNVMVQLLEYMAQIYRKSIKNSNSAYLPEVIPILIHQGSKPFQGRRNFYEFFDPKDTSAAFDDTRPRFSMRVIDLPSAVFNYKDYSNTLTAFLIALRLELHKEEELEELLRAINGIKGKKVVRIITEYLEKVLDINEVEKVVKIFEKNYHEKGGKNIMTIAEKIKLIATDEKKIGEKYRLEGIEEGKLEALIATAKKMIKNGFSVSDIESLVELPHDLIIKLKNDMNLQH